MKTQTLNEILNQEGLCGSERYVRAEVAERLLAAAKKYISPDGSSLQDFEEQLEEMKAAIKQAEEG
jgi:hypothetical protein